MNKKSNKNNRQIKKEKNKAIKKKIKKKKLKGSIDIPIVLSIFILCCIGLVMVFSASQYQALYKHGDAFYFLWRQLAWFFGGIILMFSISHVDYGFWKKLTPIGYYFTFVPLIVVLFTEPIMGATRWIIIGPLSFQPSELAKYIMVFYLAYWIEKKERIIGRIDTPFKLIIIPIVYAGLIILENNLSITAVVMFVGFIMIFVAGAKLKHLFPIAGVGFLAGMAFIIYEPYRLKRLLTFLNPWENITGDGYQIIHSFYALGSGGLFGQGLGGSKQKLSYIPEPQNDFIFSILGEEFGLIGCLIVIAIFIILIINGIKIAMQVKDKFARMLAVGIISVIAVQCLINIAVVTGSMPVTGVPLPFISYGGTSLVFNLAAMGVLLNISRKVNKDKILAEKRKSEKLNKEKLDMDKVSRW